jgi:hypothetical protein
MTLRIAGIVACSLACGRTVRTERRSAWRPVYGKRVWLEAR